MGSLEDKRLPYDYKNREYGTVPPDTTRAPFRWLSEVAYKNIHRIIARGYDTTELVEAGYGLIDAIFIDFQARIPTVEEAKMLNYVMILSLEDGLSTPAVLSRIVAKSKTYLTQACGASILAFGHAYGAYSVFGNMLDKYLARAENEGKTSEEEKLGVAGKYIAFTKEIVKAAQKISKEPVDLDMLGATGATMMDLGFSPEAIWSILAVTRTFAAGAHFCEEVEREDYTRLGETLTPKEDYDGPADRPVPSLEERAKIAKPAQAHTPEAKTSRLWMGCCRRNQASP